ncbi:hypothetical protein ARALYDRAFT_907299 [Arabidopsis lyrata subsp. lyrata]|uniref:Uncharacterized protein n=1 Tax=Arabidopsis lyrata subsp. lyrata TaxID=81972 RepID=D7LW18_ARALL|nr:hypothetical protein ARALYDRAFT_907299 [Arabidopsis lyrata subsp. lyrata]
MADVDSGRLIGSEIHGFHILQGILDLSYPSNVKNLLETGILEGAPVKYISTPHVRELQGIIHSGGYLCGCISESKSTREAIDIHHVIINGGRATGYARRRGIGFFLVLLASSMYFFLGKDNPARTLSWGCLYVWSRCLLHFYSLLSHSSLFTCFHMVRNCEYMVSASHVRQFF